MKNKKLTIVCGIVAMVSLWICPIVRANLMAEYLMNEGEGTTVNDTSGNGMTGSFAGAGMNWVNGPSASYGTALDFNGSGYVDVPDSTGSSLDVTTQMTFCAWINTDTNAISNTIAWKPGAYRIFQQYGNVYISLTGVNGGDNAAPMAVGFNQWYHIAFTYDGSNIRSYLNGVLQNTTAATGTIATNDNSLRIGWYNSTPNYDGTLDNIRIYDQALTAAQIVADKDAGGHIPEPATIGFLTLGIGLLHRTKK